MNDTLTRRLAAVLCACALAACSDKHPAAPPPAASAPAPAAAAPAPAASAPVDYAKHAVLDCEDRKIVLDATCRNVYGPALLACSRQSLTFLDGAGREVGKREFAAAKGDGDMPAMIEEKVGALTCTRTASGERYVVAAMFNGGNCEQCEWHEVYDWQGKLVGSDRDRGKADKRVADAVTAATAPGQSFGHDALPDFYAEGKQ